MTAQIEESAINPWRILDSATLHVAKVLLENSQIPYTKTGLAKNAGISRDALYRRWDTYRELGLIEEADVESGHDHYQLNSDRDSRYA